MVVYLSKPMIMRINHMLGYQGWEDLEWWTCARAKENCDHKAPMTSSLSDCTWLEKNESFVSQQRDILPYTLFFFSFTWSIPLISLLLPPIFSFFLFLFHSFFFLSFTFFSFFLSFPYSYFSLYFSLSWQLFKTINSSLSRMHTIWNFN
jgi:hypothetical protein